MEKHLYIDCTLIKNHPDGNAYMDYLVGNHFVHNVENLSYGILPFAFPFANEDYIDYVFNKLSVQKIAVPDEDDNWTDMGVLVNMDGTRIELLINADGESGPIERRIARNALVKYLEQLDFGKSDDNVVFHLGEVLRDAFNENGEEQKLPSGLHYVVVDTPFHGDIISNVLNNISIRRHEGKIEQVVMEAIGITREQAKFDHVFYPDTKCDFQGFDQKHTLDMTYFNYRDRRLILFITADKNGLQAIEISQSINGARVKVDDIHDLKSVIDQKFFNIEAEPVEPPKEEPVETSKEEPEAEPVEAPQVEPEVEPVEAPTGKPDILVTIKVNAYIDSFLRKKNETIAHTEKGDDWLVNFHKTASPNELVGFYFYTYGISKALYWWKKDFEKTERTEFDVSVDRIFDSIFCPFCKQKKRMSFSSIEVSLEYQKEGKVYCYNHDEYKGCMIFPICPQCGSKLE